MLERRFRLGPGFHDVLAVSGAFLVLSLSAGAGAAAPTPPIDLTSPPAEAERHPSGLVSLVLQEGDPEGVRPDGNDIVLLQVSGWTATGDVILHQDEPARMRLDQVFPGWRIGVGLMHPGEKRRMWIPAAIGAKGPDGSPRGDAVFEVELVAVKSIPDLDPSDVEPPEDALKTVTGARYVILEEGTGDEEVAPDSTPLVEYVGWTARDRKIFDTTLYRGRPVAMPLDRGILPAFADAILGMKVGGQRRIWIPGNVAQGQWVNTPRGDLVFEVELLQFVEIPGADGAAIPPGR